MGVRPADKVAVKVIHHFVAGTATTNFREDISCKSASVSDNAISGVTS